MSGYLNEVSSIHMDKADITKVEINNGVVSKTKSFFKVLPKAVHRISSNPVNRVAIIGAGACGTSILINLIQKLPVGSEIWVFDQTDSFGPGYPYDISQPPCFLLNRTVADMKKLAMPSNSDTETSDHFFEWIVKNKISIIEKYSKWERQFPDTIAVLKQTLTVLDKKSIVPRSLYGMYLADCFEAHVKEAKKKGINVVKVSAKVTNVDDKFVTWNQDHASKLINIDYVVLTTGHWQKPKPIEYSNVAGFYNNPMVLGFAPNDMTKIKGKTVFIKGTGLSAIDAAIITLELGAKKVTMFSRHGKLRSLKGPWKERPLVYLTLENLEKLAKSYVSDRNYFRLEHLAQLMTKELEAAGMEVDWQEVISPKDPVKTAFEELERCKSGKEFVWRSIFESSFPIHQEIFTRLHSHDKIIFLTKWLSVFMSYNSTIPADSLERLIKYFDAGRFEVKSGKIILEYNKNSETFEGVSQDSTLTADILINATGQDRKIDYMPLIQAMKERNMVSINPYGGIKISETYNLIDGDGNKVDNIFVLGALANGDILNYSDFDVLDEISKKITDKIAQHIKIISEPSRLGVFFMDILITSNM